MVFGAGPGIRANDPSNDALNPFLPTVAFSTKFQHLLSERLTSLGIMGEPRVPPLNPSETIVLSEHHRTANVGRVGKNWLRKRNGGQKWVKVKNARKWAAASIP